MIAFKAHLGVLLILIVIFNFIEAIIGSDNPKGPDFPAASGAAFLTFCVLELIVWIVYFCFIV